MQLSKKRLTELCSNGTFEEVHSTLESEQGITIPKMTLKNAIKNCGLSCKNARISISIIDDTESDGDIIGSTNTYFEETEVSHPASSNVNNY
jgi:hypothetical protein